MFEDTTTIKVHHNSLHQLKEALEQIIQDIEYGEGNMITSTKTPDYAYSLKTESNC